MLNIQLLVICVTPQRAIGPLWNTIRDTVFDWKETALKKKNTKTKHNSSQTTLDIVISPKNKVTLEITFITDNKISIDFLLTLNTIIDRVKSSDELEVCSGAGSIVLYVT